LSVVFAQILAGFKFVPQGGFLILIIFEDKFKVTSECKLKLCLK